MSIITENLNKKSQFEAIKKGDILVVEWHRDSYKNNARTRFASYHVYDNHTNNKYQKPEIILQKKNNVYFNYKLFLDPSKGHSNAKSVTLIKQGQT